MNKLDVQNVKRIQLEILDAIDIYCEKNGIKYWLDCGSLLGAIRHKGYIPWDDDIDIGMLRADFEMFSKGFNQEYEKYKIITIDSSPDFYVPFGKVVDNTTILFEPDEDGYKLAINIDVFIYDNAPNSKIMTKSIFFWRNLYYWLFHVQKCKKYPKKILRRVIFSIVKLWTNLFPEDYFMKKIQRISKKYIHKETSKVAPFCGFYSVEFDKEWFSSFVNVEFEGRKVKAPVGYHDYLELLYGDYMSLPPKEQQKTHHQYVAYLQ